MYTYNPESKYKTKHIQSTKKTYRTSVNHIISGQRFILVKVRVDAGEILGLHDTILVLMDVTAVQVQTTVGRARTI